MAGLAQAGGHRAARAQRDLVLAGAPATEHGNLHQGIGSRTPTEMVTLSPRWPREPPGGNWFSTTLASAGSVVGSSPTETTKPAFFTVLTAELRRWPSTSGTEIAPVETKIVTVEPRFTIVPVLGLWPTT